MDNPELIAFEREIADLFEAGKIHAPVHLHGNNEDALIEIFKQIKPDDWVFSTHRSHYHALLKGIPPEVIRSEILKGNSISLQFPEYHFYTSAIVAGIVPIAVGAAMAGKTCWVFVGDMAAETGIFNECFKYASGHKLPLHFVVEDNGMSVDTPTSKAWGENFCHGFPTTYTYERIYPHQGSGKFVIF